MPTSQLDKIERHATTARKLQNFRALCVSVVEVLFRTVPGDVCVPAGFWETQLGKIIKAELGDYPPLDDEAVVSGGEAAKLTGVSREQIRIWRASGKLTAVEEGQERTAYRYRLGDVRRLAAVLVRKSTYR